MLTKEALIQSIVGKMDFTRQAKCSDISQAKCSDISQAKCSDISQAKCSDISII